MSTTFAVIAPVNVTFRGGAAIGARKGGDRMPSPTSLSNCAPTVINIDALLASALGGAHVQWPREWSDDEATALVLERVAYHGIAGLLNENDDVQKALPLQIRRTIREWVLARSMWELRHKLILSTLVDELGSKGIQALLLKGSAVAYDIYPNPATRERGDTDLLVECAQRQKVRTVLRARGFTRYREQDDMPERFRSQEIWLFEADDGTSHCVDLHWQPVNAPALDRLLTFSDWFATARALPRLSGGALAPGRPLMLLHACVHRGSHECSPYFVDGRTYFGGNRLIWLADIALLGRALSEDEWCSFSRMTLDKRVADVCLDGLTASETRFGPICPEFVRGELRDAKSSRYFRSGQFRRAIMNLWGIPGLWRKCEYLRARCLPSSSFMRAKYPDMAARALPFLYCRRFVELVLPRPGRIRV